MCPVPMKCSLCGKEISAAELEESKGVCPSCGQPVQPSEADAQTSVEPSSEASEPTDKTVSSPEKPKAPKSSAAADKSKKSRKWLPWTIAAVVVVIAAAAYAMTQFGQTSKVSAEDHFNPTSISYASDDSVGIVRNGEALDLYINAAQGEENRATVSQMISASASYFGYQNYCELENGDLVYVPLDVTSVQDTEGKLCLKTASGEEKVLDENASLIYCHGDNSVYYNKMVDDKLVQTRYKDGELTPVSEIVGEENIVVVKASSDDSLLQVLQLDDDMNTVAGGYFYNGTLHLLDSSYSIFNISDQDVFVMDADADTHLVNFYRVSDLDTAELTPLASKITEAVLYDDGTMAILADCDLEANATNPIGSAYLYDPQTNSVEKVADNVVSLIDSSLRSSGWMNENGRDMTSSEMSSNFEHDQPLYAGQLHYIDGQGNLCVSSAEAATIGDSGMQGAVICENFYDVNNYSFNSDITFATATNNYLYWSRGTELYRYTLGSMEEPETISLNESVEDKASDESSQVGYITAGSGDIVEETQQTLVLKQFENEDNITVLENVGDLTLAGINNDGNLIYFISEDGSLYSKSLENRSNPKLISSDVVDAQATSDGLYYLVKVEVTPEPTIGESGEEQSSEPQTQYNLMLLEYGKNDSTLIKEDVNSISTVHIND